MFDRLRRLLGGKSQSEPAPAAPAPQPARAPAASPPPAGAATSGASGMPVKPESGEGPAEYLARVQAKITRLAEDFAAGTINRTQFQEMYGHYRQEIRTVERILEAREGDWRDAVTEGRTAMIRKRHVARAEGYAIYENESGMPVASLGKFEVDPALVVPMLSSYRSAAKEMFGGGVRSTGIDNGRWLCFISGKYTTLVALFTVEPAAKQLEFLESLHRTFELANGSRLSVPPVDPAQLVYPQEFDLGLWRSA
jgi:hypothetical protein